MLKCRTSSYHYEKEWKLYNKILGLNHTLYTFCDIYFVPEPLDFNKIKNASKP